MIDRERDAPDLEDLAAYVDGRLSGERKARVEERLLRDEDYYEVFMETVRFREEAAAVGDGVVVAPPAWRRPRVIAPLAVAAALVAAIGLWRLGVGPSVDSWVARLNAAAVLGSGDRWDDPGWERSRGQGLTGLSREQLAFRVGTLAIDLRIALAGGDSDAARGAAAGLAILTGEAMDLLPFSEAYADLGERVDGDALAVLSKEAARLDAYVAESLEGTPEAGHYRVGKWNEAGWLAAAGCDAEALAGIFRRRDRRLLASRGLAPHLENIEAVVGRPNPGRKDFRAAAEAFSAIARALAGRL